MLINFVLHGLTLSMAALASNSISNAVMPQLARNYLNRENYEICRERAVTVVEAMREQGLEHRFAEEPLHQELAHDAGTYQIALLLTPVVNAVDWDDRWSKDGSTINFANTSHLPTNRMVKAVKDDLFITFWREPGRITFTVARLSDMALVLHRSFA